MGIVIITQPKDKKAEPKKLSFDKSDQGWKTYLFTEIQKFNTDILVKIQEI